MAISPELLIRPVSRRLHLRAARPGPDETCPAGRPAGRSGDAGSGGSPGSALAVSELAASTSRGVRGGAHGSRVPDGWSCCLGSSALTRKGGRRVVEPARGSAEVVGVHTNLPRAVRVNVLSPSGHTRRCPGTLQWRRGSPGPPDQVPAEEVGFLLGTQLTVPARLVGLSEVAHYPQRCGSARPRFFAQPPRRTGDAVRVWPEPVQHMGDLLIDAETRLRHTTFHRWHTGIAGWTMRLPRTFVSHGRRRSGAQSVEW